MTNIITQYFQGILQQLRAEVDLINSLFEHQGVKGEGNEAVLRDLLRRFIPKKYGVGTGVVIDQHGKQSRQCDIVIYDMFHYPSLLALGGVHLFPVDIVYATIEIKTTLDTNSANEALENIASVKHLDIYEAAWHKVETDGKTARARNYQSQKPIGLVFAYNSTAVKFETYWQWFRPQRDEDTPNYPTLVACLDQGIVRLERKPQVIAMYPQAGDRSVGHAAPLRESFQQTEFHPPIKVASGSKSFVRDNILYPVKTVKGELCAIDQGAVLLQFVLTLTELLMDAYVNPKIPFSSVYLTDLERLRIELRLD